MSDNQDKINQIYDQIPKVKCHALMVAKLREINYHRNKQGN